MSASKMNILAGALALMGGFASIVNAEGTLTPCTTTLPAVTQPQGSTTTNGQIVYTWDVCSVIQQTVCNVISSTDVIPEPIPTGEPSGPGAEASTTPVPGYSTYHGGEYPPPGGSQPGEPGEPGQPGETGPGATAPGGTVPAGSVPGQPGYTVPGVTQPGEPGQPGQTATEGVPGGEPVPTVISTTDKDGNPTVMTSTLSHSGHTGQHTGQHSGSGSVTGPGTNPTRTGDYASGTTGAPEITATGAAAMLHGVPAAVVGAAGMAVAYLL